jgi:hypothetical protein
MTQALDNLASMYGVHPQVWHWLTNRTDIRANPSTGELFDSLLVAVARRSLKEDHRLWEGFQNLRKARNTFVHEGKAIIGGAPVDAVEARRLIGLSREILDWLDQLLPAAHRRPRYDNADQFQSTFRIFDPNSQSEPS